MHIKSLIEKLAQANYSQEELDQQITTELHEVQSAALGGAVPVSILRTGKEPHVLFIHLDGGVGDRESLLKRKSAISVMTAVGELPDSIHVSFSGGSNVFYTGGWTSWITQDLLFWVEQQYGLKPTGENTVITGISGGGHGALKIAFSCPEQFKAIAAMEPVVMPTLGWPEQNTRASWWMLEASAKAVWGEPFPEAFIAEQPVTIAITNAEKIRASGLDIYLEVGDEDLLHLQDGTEFLHRALWRADLPHEYHLVRWADHGGASVDDRSVEAMSFLAASLAGGKSQSREIALSESERLFVDYVLSGGPMMGKPVPEGASQGTAESELTVMAKLWEPLRSMAAGDPDMKRHFGRLSDPKG